MFGYIWTEIVNETLSLKISEILTSTNFIYWIPKILKFNYGLFG